MFLPRTKDTPDVTDSLSNCVEVTSTDTGETSVLGYLNRLSVTSRSDGIAINGSLSGFLYPNNVYPLDRGATQRALSKLSDMLHVDISPARVTYLEFGRLFMMAHPVERYLPLLGKLRNMERVAATPGSLYYRPKGKRKQREYVFYDKLAEATAKGLQVHKVLQGQNLLKYEIRFNGSLSRQLHVPGVEAATLCNREFYRHITAMWQGIYFAIEKAKPTTPDYTRHIKTVGNACSALFAKLLNESGTNAIAEYVAELKAAKVFKNKSDYTRLANRLRETQAMTQAAGTLGLVMELDRHVNDAGAYV